MTTQVSKPTSAIDVEVELGKDLMKQLIMEEYEGYVVLKQKGYISTNIWTRILDKVKNMGGRYIAGARIFEVPLEEKPPTSPPSPPHPDETYKQTYQERKQLFLPKKRYADFAQFKGISKIITKPEIKLTPEYEEFDSEILSLLKRSRKQQGYLETVKKDQYGYILSGRHRKKVDPKWPEEVVEVKDELDRELKIIHYNIQRKVPMEETKRRLLRIAQILEARGICPTEDIARHMSTLLPYSQRHIERLLPDKYKYVEFRPGGFKPKVFNIWNFPNCDSRYGVEGYPGRIPGQIVQNVLYFFSNSETDKIVDPMAGSGTTWDVCKDLGYKNCLCYDINAKKINELRKNHGKELCVRYNDIQNGLPEEAKDADLIFLDPYYYNTIPNQFENLEDFYKFTEHIAKVSYEAVKKGGIVTLLMCDMTKGHFIYLRGLSYDIFKKFFGEPIAVISVPFATEQANKKEILNARDSKKLLGRDRTLFVFRK